MDERIRLLLDMGVSKENVQAVVDQLDKLEDKANKSAAATDKLAKGGGNSAQAVLQLSRALQDFSSGGLLGISNNIEGIASSLGAGAAGAGVATGLFLAVQMVTPAIRGLWNAFVEGANAVPQAKGGIDGMTDALSRANKQLDELKGKQVLTNKELAEFNRLTAEAAKVQKELTEAKKREGEFQKLREQKGDEEKESAQSFGELIGPDIDALRKEAASGLTAMGQRGGTLGKLNAELQKAIRQQAGNQARDPMDLSGAAGKLAEEVDRLQARVQAERDRLAKEADRMVQGAAEGRAGGIEALIGILPGRSRFRGPLSEITPGARRAQDAELEDFEDKGRDAIERGRRRRAAEAAAKRRADQQAEEDRKADERTRQMQARIARRVQQEQAQAGRARSREAMRHAAGAGDGFNMDAVARAGVGDVEALQRRAAQAGQRLSATEAARMINEQRRQLEAAQREAFGAIMGTMNGQAQQLQYLRSIAREARRLNRQQQQPASNGGWN